MKPRVPFIKEVTNANYIYKMRFNYPHEVSKYEDALQGKGLLDRIDRMTCSNCSTFKDRAHIMRHEAHPTLEGM